ncbi:SAM-dependent methyltransferase [Saccharospirillum impatiens]|uniref:SAM-dependent methyltransferase n=1 Tax=Saccharospirillum impatiens TaxID=169438 RepID=UPI0004286564|nr:SAM-dependent methyltransferase [Saccharospirillum impatiens]
MKTRLGKRLTALFEAIPPGYDAVWDLCCDHGRLGLGLLETQRTPQVHFVDQIPSIMADLQDRLKRYGAKGYQLHTLPAEQLNLPNQGTQLLVLAGVGDEVAQAIITGVTQRNPTIQPDWLISPANKVFQVRRYLHQQGFGVLDEGVVFENGRGYEWLRVSQNRERAINPISNPAPFWNAQVPEHRAHLQKLIKHARKQLNNPKEQDARFMLELYEPLLENH